MKIPTTTKKQRIFKKKKPIYQTTHQADFGLDLLGSGLHGLAQRAHSTAAVRHGARRGGQREEEASSEHYLSGRGGRGKQGSGGTILVDFQQFCCCWRWSVVLS